MHIRVIKADRTMESYLHTKVLSTFHNALSRAGQGDLYTAEQLAEAVTFYLYRQSQTRQISTEEIHLMILAVLRDTGYDRSAQMLNQHRLERQLQRRRVEILDNRNGAAVRVLWDKSFLVEELMRTFSLERPLSRAVAGSVEEKIFRMGISRISRGLLNELIAADLEAMLSAQEQLQVS